jgi:hypothetical protein
VPRSLTILILMLGMALGAAADGPRALPEALGYRNAALDGTSVEVKDWTFNSGSMALRFDHAVASVIRIGGKPAGLFLNGRGAFTYKVADPVFIPTMLYNLKENTRLTAREEGGSRIVGDTVTRAILWFAGPAVPPLDGKPGTTDLADAFKTERAFFTLRDRVGEGADSVELETPPFGQLLAYRELNRCEGQVVLVQLDCASDHFVYAWDGVLTRTETLQVERHLGVDTLARFVLAQVPLGWARTSPPDPDVHLTHLDLDLEAGENRTGRMRVEETLQIIRSGLRCLVFNFNHGEGAKEAGKMDGRWAEIRSLRSADGQELPFELSGGNLTVDLGRPMRNGDIVKLTMEIDGTIHAHYNVDFKFWRLTPGSCWFPEPTLSAQGYTVKARIAVDKPFIPIASAATVTRSTTATQNVLEVIQDKPIIWFSVAAGKYQSVELVVDNRVVRAWCYSGIPVSAKRLLKVAQEFIALYDQLLGGVPFNEINLVEVPELGFGQAPPGMIWLTKEIFNPVESETTRFLAGHGAVGGWTNHCLAHELAHQYWGGRVKPFTMADNWLSEGFAEFMSGQAMRAMRSKGEGVYQVIVADWKKRADTVSLSGTIPTTQFMHPVNGNSPTARNPIDLLYAKGAYLLAWLQKDLGKEAFQRFLTLYQKRFAWYPPSTAQDVADALKAATGKDYAGWMEKNFWGTGVPDWDSAGRK